MSAGPFRYSGQKGVYEVEGRVSEADIMAMAERLVKRRFRRGQRLTSPQEAKAYLSVKLATLEHEQFCVLFLDTRHRLLAFETLFRGTIDGATVHPREVVKRALGHNAAALIAVHNHPSGDPSPSQSDRQITTRLREALALVEIRLLDHLVVGGTEMVSLAEWGCL